MWRTCSGPPVALKRARAAVRSAAEPVSMAVPYTAQTHKMLGHTSTHVFCHTSKHPGLIWRREDRQR